MYSYSQLSETEIVEKSPPVEVPCKGGRSTTAFYLTPKSWTFGTGTVLVSSTVSMAQLCGRGDYAASSTSATATGTRAPAAARCAWSAWTG